ncbi:MAG: Hint domain-containing protein [Pseudomonadota bacterium]
MATTFTVFSLGQLPIWDPVEGNTILNRNNVFSALQTFGSPTDPLFQNRVEFAPAGNGFSGGTATDYDIDGNISQDQFSIDGGATQDFDALMIFEATITYDDNTTADISAVVFQDSSGNTYWAPEFTDNADQAAIEAKPIVSLQLTNPIFANGFNQGFTMFADRVDSMPLCFTAGTRIACPGGDREIDTLRPGDLVMTLDHGPQPIRWIGRRRVAATGAFAPVRLRAGTFGAHRDTELSQQHRLLLDDARVEYLFAEAEVLAAAKHLVDGHEIALRQGGEVTYIHLLFDRHEVIRANGIAAETLLPSAALDQAVDEAGRAEIRALFPDMDLSEQPVSPARPVLKSHEAKLWARDRRHAVAEAMTAKRYA